MPAKFTRLPCVCTVCQRTFLVPPCWIRRGAGRYCSRTCYETARVPPLAERLAARTDKTPTCWLWTGATIKGYGRLTVDDKTMYAHRAAWIVTHGPSPDGLFVCHRCDVPLCVNPAHLFLGTVQDNLADMRAKGRAYHQKLNHG